MTGEGTRSGAAPHRVCLALQGGGSHGAFTWGVLDRLLEEDSFAIDTVSGTSAGAINAVALADGLTRGGRDGARRTLRALWEGVGRLPGLATWFAPFLHQRTGGWRLDDSPAYIWFDLMSRLWSPYDLNPTSYNPLRGLLDQAIDFARLRQEGAVGCMVCATNVRTGRRRVFSGEEISADAVLASACLPTLFPAVMIDGEPYWDGGFTGNPAIAPLYWEARASDIIVVGINPAVREAAPRAARDIIDRVNEISFNAAFWLELSAIALLTQLREQGVLAKSFRLMNFHGIGAGAQLAELGASSKLNNHPDFLRHLFDLGREAADAWLRANGAAIGLRSTLDLTQLLPLVQDAVQRMAPRRAAQD
jgi:NTE family protein